MRKILTAIFSLFLLVTGVSANDRVTHDVNQLPAAARQFITTHFPKAPVSYLSIDRKLFGVEGYDVRLIDGTEIDFNNKGEWKEIDAEHKVIPAAIIPENIKKYINQYYPQNKVTKIKHTKRGYELHLNNDLEVDFDQRGNFLRLDD
ncbi:MAG: PepSY-like domain-containing protein [Bacteroidaceae bacterium]|nr:PepSY-like domain-containing protein [Bacteroidaceae bacterium]